MAGLADSITNSVKLKLELTLSLAISFIDQHHVLAESYKDWRGTDLEWFFSETIGMLEIDGKAKTKPKVLSSYQFSFVKSTVRLCVGNS